MEGWTFDIWSGIIGAAVMGLFLAVVGRIRPPK